MRVDQWGWWVRRRAGRRDRWGWTRVGQSARWTAADSVDTWESCSAGPTAVSTAATWADERAAMSAAVRADERVATTVVLAGKEWRVGVSRDRVREEWELGWVGNKGVGLKGKEGLKTNVRDGCLEG